MLQKEQLCVARQVGSSGATMVSSGPYRAGHRVSCYCACLCHFAPRLSSTVSAKIWGRHLGKDDNCLFYSGRKGCEMGGTARREIDDLLRRNRTSETLAAEQILPRAPHTGASVQSIHCG